MYDNTLHNKNGINYFRLDKQGNTIKEENQAGNNIFEYNTLNQKVKAITKEENTLVSRYDTEGLRAEIEENEKLTKFIFYKENVLVEVDKGFNTISRFTRGYEVVAADISDGELDSEENRYYYTQDENGSTIFITDKNQGIRNEYYYDAFGGVLEAKEEVHNRITYTGQQFDGITGQYYLRARFYNPVGYYDSSGYSSLNKENTFAKEPFSPEYYYQKLDSNIAKAIDARDAEVVRIQSLSKTQQSKITTVVGGVDLITGEVAVGVKNSILNKGKAICAEDLVFGQLGRNTNSNIIMTPAIRPRTGVTIPVCTRCQTKFPENEFIKGTVFD